MKTNLTQIFVPYPPIHLNTKGFGMFMSFMFSLPPEIRTGPPHLPQASLMSATSQLPREERLHRSLSIICYFFHQYQTGFDGKRKYT